MTLPALAAFAGIAIAIPVHAQATPALPDYAPLSPTLSLRSGLSSYGYRAARTGWTVETLFEYGSAAELQSTAASSYVLDAELMRTTLTARRDVGARTFIDVRAGVTGAYAGFADGVFDAYHRIIRYQQHGRGQRPTNEYAHEIRLGDVAVVIPPGRVDLAGVRVGAGRRHTARLQSYAAVTLPTATAHPRGVPSFALMHTLRAPAGARVHYDATVGIGHTPSHGPLAGAQHTRFVAASFAARADVWRGHALYWTVFHHSAPYRGTGIALLDRGELSTDFGVVLSTPDGGEWRIGLVEDLRHDAGMDLVIRVSRIR